MKKSFYKTVSLTVSLAVILIAGCEEGYTSGSEIKRSRLLVSKIAAENKQLKKETEQVKKQSEQLRKELENQKELLAESVEDDMITQERLRTVYEKRLQKAANENKMLRQTIERLEAQLKQLEEDVKYMENSEELNKQEQAIKDLTENTVRYLEEIAKLQEENKNLKAEIAKLKKE